MLDNIHFICHVKHCTFFLCRQVLERKAAMYDKIHQGIEVLEDDQLNQRFLVNFQVST